MAERRLSLYTASPEPPDNPPPFNGECWLDTTSGIEYRWAEVSGFWVEGGGSENYPQEPEIDQLFEHEDQQWRWNGKGWALVKPFWINEAGDVETSDRVVTPAITLDDDDLGETLATILDRIGLLLGEPIYGAIIASEAPDTALFTGVNIAITGTMDATEAPDTARFLGGGVPIEGELTASEEADVASIVGGIFGYGVLSATEAPDTAVFEAPSLLSMIETLQNQVEILESQVAALQTAIDGGNF